MKKSLMHCIRLFSMKRACHRMENEAAYGHEEFGGDQKTWCAFRFIFHGGASRCFMFVPVNASLILPSYVTAFLAFWGLS